MKKQRRDIGSKLTLIVAASTLIFLFISVGMSYFYLFDSSRSDTMDSRRNLTKLMAGSISDIIDSQEDIAKINASSAILEDAVEASNAKYKGSDAETARKQILDIDSMWIKSPADHPLIAEYLGNKASMFLKANTKQRSGFFNILACDKYGSLVGASYKPRVFYCGDEEWFKEIFSGSKKRTIFGDAVFDESTGKWSFSITTAIEDARGEVSGVYRASVDISALFKPLEEFTAGRGARAALIDSRGYLIYYPGVKPFSNKFCEYNELKRLLSDNNGYSVVDTAYMGKGKTVVVVSPVTSPALSDRAIKLYVILAGSSSELFSPLNNLAVKMVIFSIILGFTVLVLTGVVFKGIFASPIRELIDGMRRLGEGRLDYRVDIKTGDEMEDLAEALNSTAENLSHITTSIKTLDKERSERRVSQERFEKENLGFLSLMSQVHSLLFDISRGIEAARQEAIKSNSDKPKKDLEILESRAGSLIKNLEKDIYASKLETGSLEFNMEPKDMKDIIKELIFTFEPRIREKGLDLRIDIPKTALPVRADIDKIRQVFSILIENSLASTEKGYIMISAVPVKDGIECAISDTGAIIPKEALNDVFERFSDFSRIGRREGPWTDPDFYIIKRIIERHGGRAIVESIPGERTVFKFTIPNASTVLK